jgi:hypothetical protein
LTQLRDDPSLRLQLRAELQKRISRLEFIFMPDKLGVAAFLTYTNGAIDSTFIFGREVAEDILQAKGLFRIQRYRNQPREFHESLKADLLQWVREQQEVEVVAL